MSRPQVADRPQEIDAPDDARPSPDLRRAQEARLAAAWRVPTGWRSWSAVNDTVVGQWYIAVTLAFFVVGRALGIGFVACGTAIVGVCR
jgi:hypothetical protein